jgi:DNA-binding MarR family transcriptional regulator
VLDHAVAAVLAAYPTVLAACRRRLARPPRAVRRLSDHLTGLLEHLDLVTPLPIGDLAARARVSPATISLQVDRLVRSRLVQRSRDPRDGRRVLLRLTDEGAMQRTDRTLLDPDRVREALARLPAEQRDALAAGLRALARTAVALPAELETPRRESPHRRTSS